MIMIDWISSAIRTPDQVYTGERTTNIRLERSPQGEILKEYRIGKHVDAENEPSSSRKFYVHTPDQQTLLMSGNPAKFLQGHNAFGSDDLLGLYLESGILLRQNAGLFPSPDSWDACCFSVPQFSRIDITRSYRFTSDAEKQDYIRYVAGTARTRHGAAKLYGSETAVFGEGSRRWSFKVYDKLAEYKKNNKCRQIDDELMDWLVGVARFELCLRGQELTAVNDYLRLRCFDVPLQDIWEMYFDRITFNDNSGVTMAKTIQNYENLSNVQKGIYLRWQAGEDLRHTLTKTTYYRVRNELKSLVGVDISVPPSATIAEDKKPVRIDLNASGWDPEPLKHRMFTPRDEIKKEYGFTE